MNYVHRIASVLVIGLGLGLVVSVGACSSGGGTPDAGAMPAGATFSGLWLSPQFEHMYLHQQGSQVEGVYVYGGGGKIEGEVEGNLLIFSWEEPGDRQAAQRDMRGKGYLQLSIDAGEPQLRGEWGYNDDRAGAGPWEAEFIRERKDDDPTTLEQLQQRH